jgi:spore germination cell wall hydrolase CwlJ-like protein
MTVTRHLACTVPLLPVMAASLLVARPGVAADYVPVGGLDRDAIAAVEQPVQLAASEVECMAKVVMHEAGHEPRQGKVAVAQTLANRLSAGRFGSSICAVANQPGQYFKTAAYHPDQADGAWNDAVAVARAVLSGAEDDVTAGAIFFRPAAHPASSFFRTRERVASIGAQIFYR